MQLCRRCLLPGELDHEFIWLSVSLSSLAAAAAWFAVGLPWPRCLFHDLTGFPCVTCGMTRSAIAFFHGYFLVALRWNPLVFIALCGLSIFNAYALGVVVTRAARLRVAQVSKCDKDVVRIGLIGAFALNWIYVLVSQH
jgi:hypothetical protein